MQGFFIFFVIFLGLTSTAESEMGFFGEDIEILLEKKMESVMKKYDRKIALLEDKINSQEKKIQVLEEKCSGLVMGAEKGKEITHFFKSIVLLLTSIQFLR